MAVKVYLAGPLFNDMEKERNEMLCEAIESWEYEVFLPQRDAGEAAEDSVFNRGEIFQADIEGMDSCDICVAMLDGRTMDEGTCFEIGYMYAKNKPVIYYKTDKRSFMEGFDNVMIMHSGAYTFNLCMLENVLLRYSAEVK